jgi:hypothetical protein
MPSSAYGIEKQAAFYRGYLADDRNLAEVAVVLATAIAFWLLLELISLVGPYPAGHVAAPAAPPAAAVVKSAHP